MISDVSPFFHIMRLPCDCLVVASMFAHHNIHNVGLDDYLQCPWCETTLPFKEMQTWLANAEPEPILMSLVKPLYRAGDRLFEPNGKRCHGCGTPLLCEHGKKDEFHFDRSSFEIVRN